ncbi:MAG: PD-(D/E)XK nuclease family protein [Methanocorpusculum sp.]|nr:PD-(D/E)XK nuclease family protein [Methanocorpusculum sp.]
MPLSSAVAAFKTSSRQNLFGTWLIIEKKEHLNRAQTLLGAPALQNHITTPLDLGTLILTSADPKTRILKTEEQFLIFGKIAADPKYRAGLANVPDATTESLISLYTLLTANGKTLPETTPKLTRLNEIFTAYRTWCSLHSCTDKITALQSAVQKIPHTGLDFSRVIYYGRPADGTLNRSLIDALGNVTIIEPAEHTMETPAELKTSLAYPDYKKELTSVFEHIARLIDAGVSPDEIILLHPSLTETLPLLLDLSRDFFTGTTGAKKPLTFSTGEKLPVINSPVIRPVISLLGIPALGYRTGDLLGLLGASCFTKNWNITIGELKTISTRLSITGGKPAWLSIEKRLTAGKTTPAAAEYAARKQTAIRNLISTAEYPGETWKDRAEGLIRLLHNLGWMQNRKTSPAEQNAASAFLRLMETLTLTSLAGLPCSAAEFYRAVSHFCATDTAAGLTATGFRIAPLSSAAETMADYVFACGLTSAKLPVFEQTLPLLTAEESAFIWKDRIQNTLDDQKKTFCTLLTSAKKELHLSFAEKGIQKNTAPSPYLTRISAPEKAASLPLLHSRTENQKRAGIYIASGEGEKCAGLFGLTQTKNIAQRIRIETIERAGKHGIYSAEFTGSELEPVFAETYGNPNEELAPTTLESYLKCPFKWYLRHHLGLSSPQDESSEAKLLGSAVHRALEQFFKTLPEPVSDKTKAAALASLRQCIAEEMERTGIRTPSWQARLDQYRGEGGLARTLEQFIDRECAYTAQGFVTGADCLEQEIAAEFEQNGERLRVRGFADRILQKADGTFTVIDYKTGTLPDSRFALQLPLYIRAVEQERHLTGTAGLYLQIKPDAALKEKPLVRGAPVSDAVDEAVLQCFAARDGMRRGVCRVTAQPKCPDDYCEYRRICRYSPSAEVEDAD